MPYMQTALSSMNFAFSAAGVDGADEDVIESWRPTESNSLVESMRRHPQIDLPDFVLEFVDTLPSGLKRAVQSIVWENFIREVTVPITFAWQPGYDNSITVHDVYDTKETRGGITIVFTTRYPADRHPLTVSKS